ncbi:MAG: methylated-DNA--[protein]-cysteine S-methyltransferase [Candidatus Moranbacteria bacterium]|nr:methylated-DNA--[protein]-cysteine S-methyltransferase [Candidatus Moranbacteria bacterium]
MVDYLVYKSFIGYVLMAETSKGFCWVEMGNSKNVLLKEFQKKFEGRKLQRVSETKNIHFKKLIDYLEGKVKWNKFSFDVESTDFKKKVWRYMQTIPEGEVQSYSQIAEAIGSPRAYRAVASACATNPMPLVVPCHRVVPKSGGIGQFSSGIFRKNKLLQAEGLSFGIK